MHTPRAFVKGSTYGTTINYNDETNSYTCFYDNDVIETIKEKDFEKLDLLFATFDTKEGHAETFNLAEVLTWESDEDFTIIGSIEVQLEGLNLSVSVPIFQEYSIPYDSAITDEIGTEHYIYYNEVDKQI